MLPDNANGLAISIEGLSRRFRRTLALDNVSLSVPRGTVLGLVGSNGAGKSTLIQHILGLLRAQEGTVRVLGRDPVREPVEVLGQIGYMSEHRDLPGWMRVRELIRYCRGIYPDWDDAYANELLELFGLDPSARIRTLSLGQTAKAGLLSALAHRPELLVLDEPSSGLDPVVRRDILGAVYRAVAQEGRSVLFSSHLLDDVESVVDHVIMIDKGRIVFSAPMTEIRERHCRVTIEANQEMPSLPGYIGSHTHGNETMIVCEARIADIKSAIAGTAIANAPVGYASLDEIFVARTGHTA